jgi:hypothetical protein
MSAPLSGSVLVFGPTDSTTQDVDANVARANQAVAQSKDAIALTNKRLDRHEEWLHHHRILWEKDFQRCKRVIKRKLTLLAIKRYLILVVTFIGLGGVVALTSKPLVVGISAVAFKSKTIDKLASTRKNTTTKAKSPSRLPIIHDSGR